MKRAAVFGILIWTSGASAWAGHALHVSPAEPPSEIRDRLATDPDIVEVILAAGVYREELVIPPLDDPEAAARPLLIRPAAGAEVIFDGHRELTGAMPAPDMPGVFYVGYPAPAGEYPKLWEPDARVRYRLAADTAAVARFPATYAIAEGRIYFRTSDGLPPGDRVMGMSALDHGLSIARSHVTVRDIEFRNYVARDKWSAAVDLHGDHITVERCRASNCSRGFIVMGRHDALVRCSARDVGGGVFIKGEEARIEECRFLKRRDSFMVPMYRQDDTGIQFYNPARGGVVRGNLCAGFDTGILIKALRAPYLIEHNTLVGQEMQTGLMATNWHPDEVFRLNIVSGFKEPIRAPRPEGRQKILQNCLWSPEGPDLKPIGEGSIVGDPAFIRPEAEDYRLGPDSDCRELGHGDGSSGAFPVAAWEPPPWTEPRDWHVGPGGRDGFEGTAERPVRTIQFAVDHASPGDTIIVHPGLYTEPVRIRRGGVKRQPIVIRAARPWTAILDGGRSTDFMIAIEKAPYVEIHDLEIRWYRRAGISVRRSPHVTVAGCRIWNAHWPGTWPTGAAIDVWSAPGFVGHHNVLFRQEYGFRIYRSPGSRITYNTCIANLYAAASFLYSAANSVCRNNSFAFQGNDVVVILVHPDEEGDLKTFDSDYNNYGTQVRDQAAGVAFDRVVPRAHEPYVAQRSKAIVNYMAGREHVSRFTTMRDWRAFSGLDGHSVFADPLYVATAARDFRLDPSSPNIAAGENGTTIGALEAAGE